MSDSHATSNSLRPETWEEYDRLRAAWLSRLMFGGFCHPPMPAGEPPELPWEADELAKRFEDYDPKLGDEREPADATQPRTDTTAAGRNRVRWLRRRMLTAGRCTCPVTIPEGAFSNSCAYHVEAYDRYQEEFERYWGWRP